MDDAPVETPSISARIVLSDNLEEKFRKLGVDGELRLSILSGMVEPRGSCSYLNEETESASVARMSLVYTVKEMQNHLMQN